MTARQPLFWFRVEAGRPSRVEPAAVRAMALAEGASAQLVAARVARSKAFRTERATYEPRFAGRRQSP